jgi:putative transposase
MRFIELNPIRANMARQPKNYRWSSYHHNANEKADALVTSHNLYLSLSNDENSRQAKYAALFKERLSQLELESIRAAANKAWVLGSKKFRKRVE